MKSFPICCAARARATPSGSGRPAAPAAKKPTVLPSLMAEATSRLRARPSVQIFATDIDEQMLQKARSASYPHTAVKDVPLELLDRYFFAQEDDYVLTQAIRDMVRVSNHNLIKDPPFSRVDIIVCRNLLDLFQSEPAAAPDPGLPLRLAPEWLAVSGLGRKHRGPRRSFRYRRDGGKNLPAARGACVSRWRCRYSSSLWSMLRSRRTVRKAGPPRSWSAAMPSCGA